MKNFLFDEFQLVSAKQWKQKIQFDLKGSDYNKTLLTNTDEGIKIKPFYHQDEFKQLEVPQGPSGFSICQSIFVNDAKTSNFLALDAINRGARSIQFIAKESFDFKLLLKDLLLIEDDNKVIYFQLYFFEEEFIIQLMDYIKNKEIFLNIDIIGNLVKSGNWFYNKQKDHLQLRSILQKSKNNITVLGVDVALYQNAGSNIVQQVSYALAHANEYLNFISQSDIQSIRKINFKFSIGENYFFEIAKLRSFRYLWKLLIQEYNLDIEAVIFSEPSLRNKTLYDYNVNMLRTTTESMSAILGGSNTISNLSYDAIFHKKNDFGERIARNQLIILKEESNLNNQDYVDGTYYIEEITAEISEKALTLFKDIERSGGFVKQLFDGTIQRKIDENAQKQQSQFDIGELVLLGTNKHLNKDDRIKSELELYPFLKTKNIETMIRPILAKRLAEQMEKERMEKE